MRGESGKSHWLAENLKSLILCGRYPSDAPVPPIAELCRQYGFSYGVVQRALALLQQQQVLIRHGRRLVVSDRTRAVRRRRRVAVLLPISEPDFWPPAIRQTVGLFSTALLGIQDAAHRLDCWLSLLHIRREDDTFAALGEIHERLDGLIIFNEFDRVRRERIGAIPTVGVLVGDNSGNISVIDINPIAAARQALDYFERRGVRRVRIYSDARQTYLHRADAFRIGWYRRFGELPEIVVVYQGVLPPAQFEADCGLFFSSDTVAHLYASSYRQTCPGRSLYTDFPVVSVDGKRLLSPHYGVFPTVAVDWRELGIAALEECLALAERPGRPGRTIYFPGTLVES